MPKLQVQWLNVYGHILDRQVIDASSLPQVLRDLPKVIPSGSPHEAIYFIQAVGVEWFQDNKHVGTHWHNRHNLPQRPI